MRQADFLYPQQKQSWVELFINRLNSDMSDILNQQKTCSVFLTGGKSAKALYPEFSRSLLGFKDQSLHFFLGDERFLPHDHFDTNAHTIRTTFDQDSLKKFQFYPVLKPEVNKVDSVKNYNQLVEGHSDIIMFSLGEDAHIASLFPHQNALQVRNKKYISSEGVSPYKDRITISFDFINVFKHKYVMVVGEQKALVLKQALKSKNDISLYPVLGIQNACFVLDETARQILI